MPDKSNLIKKIIKKINLYWSYKKRFSEVRYILSDKRFAFRWSERLPVFSEDTETTKFDAHYVFHTAWAARILAKKMPKLHVDISSDLRFVTLVSAFIPIDFYDYRAVDMSLSGLTSMHGDLMSLPFDDNSVESLSCMHVVEHIGLERYGDPLDPVGDIKAMDELYRVLAVDGLLFFVVPIGGEARIQYNAHRIYTFDMVCSKFKDLYLESFALITDQGEFIEYSGKLDADKQRYGCGCFLFRKP